MFHPAKEVGWWLDSWVLTVMVGRMWESSYIKRLGLSSIYSLYINVSMYIYIVAMPIALICQVYTYSSFVKRGWFVSVH